MARISFLLPTYNGAAHIAETLRSILLQDSSDFDVLILDDGSTDNTQEIVEKFKDSRLRYQKQENSGLVNTLNSGLEILDCEFVARIDADDICFPDRVSKQLDFIQFTKADAVSSRVMNINSAGRIISLSSGSEQFFQADPGAVPANEPYLPHPFMMARLAILNELGGYRHMHLAEDSDLCWRLKENYRTALQSDVLGCYRQHSSNISNQGIASGRVQAFFSQLSALNIVRRKSGKREILFGLSLSECLEIAKLPDGLINRCSEYLSQPERKWLEAATSAKLLDISTYRFLPLDKEDIKFAEKAITSHELSADDKTKVSSIFAQVKTYHPALFPKRSIWQNLLIKRWF